MQNKLKHLEFLQAVITRLNSNSFAIKGFTMALVTGIAALAYKEENKNVLLISIVIIGICWATDAYFLCFEKRYRAIYNEVRLITDDNAVDFNMTPSDMIKAKHNWATAATSNTFYVFYLPLFLIHLIILAYFFIQ